MSVSAAEHALMNAVEACCHLATYPNGKSVRDGFIVDSPITIMLEHDVLIKLYAGDQILLDFGNYIVRVHQVKENAIHEIVLEHVMDVKHSSYGAAPSLW